MFELGIQLVIGVVFGGICAIVAHGRGRSAVGWFFVGIVSGCIGLIILLAIEDLAKARLEKSRRDAETRRLREQLRADRQLSDQRHEGVNRRLEVHDKALGVDTAPEPPSAIAAAAAPEMNITSAPWYYDGGNGKRLGPLDFAALRDEWTAGRITSETFVWTTGMRDWRRVGELPGMVHDLDS